MGTDFRRPGLATTLPQGFNNPGAVLLRPPIPYATAKRRAETPITCLYCGGNLPRQTQVDHFIPWSRYPADLGHNFVLAHKACNNAKADYLAAEKHLAAWVERNRLHQEELRSRLQEAALPCDLPATIQIAKWVYQQTAQANGQVWMAEKVLQHLSPAWPQCFAALEPGHPPQ
jgi:5-methylcytosine-specific restriction endonuclease McrA